MINEATMAGLSLESAGQFCHTARKIIIIIVIINEKRDVSPFLLTLALLQVLWYCCQGEM